MQGFRIDAKTDFEWSLFLASMKLLVPPFQTSRVQTSLSKIEYGEGRAGTAPKTGRASIVFVIRYCKI